jgi:hypothetical protein
MTAIILLKIDYSPVPVTVDEIVIKMHTKSKEKKPNKNDVE